MGRYRMCTGMILVQITTHISEYGQFIESVFDEAINYYAGILAV